MTNNLRDEIARREKICAAATPGPWWRERSGCAVQRTSPLDVGTDYEEQSIGSFDDKVDSDFAAHARTGYPETLQALADAVAALEFYADPNAWDTNNTATPVAVGDAGEIARAALAQIAGRLGHMDVGREGNI